MNNTCLVYLRFDDAGAVQTYHVSTPGKAYVPGVLIRARKRGLTAGAKLVEYAAFSSLRTIHKIEAPNFHFMTMAEFFEQTGGVPRSENDF